MPAPTDQLVLGDDLRSFVDASPSPAHAVAELARRLRAAGFTELAETDSWAPSPGAGHYVVRHGSLVAFRLGSRPLSESGLRIVGAHTDSPTFKVRPHPDVRQAGYRLVGVEPYGGGLWHTWLDRELTVAGRVALRGGSLTSPATALVRLPGAPLRLPSLAIHLDRSVREGLTLDPQKHLVPVWDRDLGTEPGLAEALADAVGATPDDVVGHDLVLADTQPAGVAGADGSWIAAPRLDNLGCCHSGLLALLAATPASGRRCWSATTTRRSAAARCPARAAASSKTSSRGWPRPPTRPIRRRSTGRWPVRCWSRPTWRMRCTRRAPIGTSPTTGRSSGVGRC
jgi:aspartyl aminopeptidase